MGGSSPAPLAAITEWVRAVKAWVCARRATPTTPPSSTATEANTLRPHRRSSFHPHHISRHSLETPAPSAVAASTGRASLLPLVLCRSPGRHPLSDLSTASIARRKARMFSALPPLWPALASLEPSAEAAPSQPEEAPTSRHGSPAPPAPTSTSPSCTWEPEARAGKVHQRSRDSVMHAPSSLCARAVEDIHRIIQIRTARKARLQLPAGPTRQRASATTCGSSARARREGGMEEGAAF